MSDWDWKPIDSAPRDGNEIDVRDAQGRHADAWWSKQKNCWRSGGVHHGFPLVPELDGHPWVEWRPQGAMKIVPLTANASPGPDDVVILPVGVRRR